MAKQWDVQCDECGEKNKFSDAQDVTHAHWQIIAWVLPSCEPRVRCNKCEYKKPHTQKKKK